MAAIVASVPELTILTFSTEGTIWQINSAISTSFLVGAPYESESESASRTASSIKGWAWPSNIGPQELIISIYRFPSSSYRYAPLAFLIKIGFPPTDLNALTGEFTPPGIDFWALSKRFSLCLIFMFLQFSFLDF